MQEGRLLAAAAAGDAPRSAAAGAREDAWRRFSRAATTEEFCQAWLAIQCAAIGEVSDGVVLLRSPGQELLTPAAFHPRLPLDRTLFAEVIDRALAEGRGVVLPRLKAAAGHEGLDPASEAPVAYQLALPLQLGAEVAGAVGLEIASRDDAGVRAAMRELQWGSGWLEAWLRRQAAAVPAVGDSGQRVQVALDLVATLLEHRKLREGGAAFVTQLAARLGCDRVALGLLKGGRSRLRAMSHSSQVLEQGNLARAVEQAMDEAIDQRAAIACPPGEEGDTLPVVRFAHLQLLQASGGGAVLTLPLLQGDQTIGALTFERAAGHGFDPALREMCQAVAAVAGPLVGLQRAGERHLLAHAGASALGARDALLGPRHAGWKLAAAAAVLLVLFFTFVNGDHRVTAESAVEGELQRSLSAPINGFVREASHRAGDSVRQGTVIARLDDRDLRVERAKLLSQSEQFVGQYREATATRERAQALMANAQLEQARAQIALIEEQIARTVIVAPFDAVIVTGDFSRKLGSPVERGQSMFEVAPLNSFRVSLQVDEHDFAYVQLGQRGTLTVNSMPGASFPFEVSKITAVNEARDGRNTFRIEARVVGDHGRLRPGMKGVGKIDIGERRLAWIWTHGLFDRLRLWFWNWLP